MPEVRNMKQQILDAQSYSPLYRQLIKKLRDDIAAGRYPVNSRIPSEQELCQTYGVSRVTVRKALVELTREGLLRRHQGKGTFVSIPRLYKDLKDVTSFHEACRHMNCVPGARVLHAQLTHAAQEDRERLRCQDEQVVEIVRLRLADDVPVMLENNHFPLQYEWLIRENLSGSLYQLLQQHGVEVQQAIHEISLCYATPAQARWLEVEPGSALLQLNEVICDQHGQPLHTSWQLIRGDRFTFRI